MRPLTNKQATVLAVVRRADHEMTVHEVAKATDEGIAAMRALRRDWRGRWLASAVHAATAAVTRTFGYSDAYQALVALRKRGSVSRRCARDEWGDELPRHVYRAVPEAMPDDDVLEQLFRAPALGEETR